MKKNWPSRKKKSLYPPPPLGWWNSVLQSKWIGFDTEVGGFVQSEDAHFDTPSGCNTLQSFKKCLCRFPAGTDGVTGRLLWNRHAQGVAEVNVMVIVPTLKQSGSVPLFFILISTSRHSNNTCCQQALRSLAEDRLRSSINFPFRTSQDVY